MNKKLTAAAAACSFAFAASAFAQAPKPAAAPAATPAPAAPAAAAPAAPPAWKQGMGDKYKDSTLAPNPGKNTETPASEIPINTLKVPKGFKVELWASGMPGARAMVRGDKGKIYIGTRGLGRVYEVTDAGDKRTSRVLVDKLTQPSGVAMQGSTLYVMSIDKVLRYDDVENKPDAKPEDMPDKKLYVPFGAPCNICEPSKEYAQIRRYNPDGTGMEVIATGVRNTQGFDWHPKTGELWFTDHGRDWAGDDGPQDELNRMTKTGLNFGYPYCHAAGTPDPDIKKADACKDVTKPVALMGPHSAVMGVKFYTGDMFPAAYKNTMFVARKGSWNRTQRLGYDVVNVVPSADGKTAKVTPFLTGFLDTKENKFSGRPAYILQMPDGALLVSDEQLGAIYRISYSGGTAKK
jgi:glucose/arabinose dehydrogenase